MPAGAVILEMEHESETLRSLRLYQQIVRTKSAILQEQVDWLKQFNRRNEAGLPQSELPHLSDPTQGRD